MKYVRQQPLLGPQVSLEVHSCFCHITFYLSGCLIGLEPLTLNTMSTISEWAFQKRKCELVESFPQ